MENKVYIYGLIDPSTNELRYVGKSISPKTRLRKHISERNLHDTYKDRWLCKLHDNKLKPEIIILDIVDESEWVFWEQHYISYFKCLGCRLTNATLGGDQPPSTKGRKHSEESKLKMSKSKIGKSIPWLNNGNPRTKKHRDNLSKSLKGRISPNKGKKFSEEYKKKLSKAHKGLQSGDKHPMYGKKHNDKTKKKLSEHFSLKIVQLSLNNEFIQIWDSIKKAQEGINIKNGISNCCQGKQKTAGGYKWKYLEDYERNGRK